MYLVAVWQPASVFFVSPRRTPDLTHRSRHRMRPTDRQRSAIPLDDIRSLRVATKAAANCNPLCGALTTPATAQEVRRRGCIGSVTAPREALPTSCAYLASAPLTA